MDIGNSLMTVEDGDNWLKKHKLSDKYTGEIKNNPKYGEVYTIYNKNTGKEVCFYFDMTQALVRVANMEYGGTLGFSKFICDYTVKRANFDGDMSDIVVTGEVLAAGVRRYIYRDKGTGDVLHIDLLDKKALDNYKKDDDDIVGQNIQIFNEIRYDDRFTFYTNIRDIENEFRQNGVRFAYKVNNKTNKKEMVLVYVKGNTLKRVGDFKGLSVYDFYFWLSNSYNRGLCWMDILKNKNMLDSIMKKKAVIKPNSNISYIPVTN